MGVDLFYLPLDSSPAALHLAKLTQASNYVSVAVFSVAVWDWLNTYPTTLSGACIMSLRAVAIWGFNRILATGVAFSMLVETVCTIVSLPHWRRVYQAVIPE
ncbi:hypothetical protein JCM1841_006484 [Sporobolomyces salmonicolor]